MSSRGSSCDTTRSTYSLFSSLKENVLVIDFTTESSNLHGCGGGVVAGVWCVGCCADECVFVLCSVRHAEVPICSCQSLSARRSALVHMFAQTSTKDVCNMYWMGVDVPATGENTSKRKP